MRICFYAPFKPLGHPHPSGDLIIGTGLHDFLVSRGHELLVASDLRSRWIYWKPWRWWEIVKERFMVARKIRAFSPDIWLTYHSYYKAPDLLGPGLCRKFHLPYSIFQGIYSTKQKRSLKGAPGFYLNRKALLQAGHLYSNREIDLENLKRIVPNERLSYIRPGIFPEQFQGNEEAGREKRNEWGVGEEPLILSAAMFRPDVKTEGLSWMIKTLGGLAEQDIPFKLVIAGDGSEREKLVSLANHYLPGRVLFIGRVNREKMYQFYSAGDLFAFPGIRESLGMVFLEAQSCGLPVVAFDNGGIPEVVQRGKTGLLTKPFDEKDFCRGLTSLLQDPEQRQIMGTTAAKHVRSQHDLHRNYLKFEETLLKNAQISG
ncbi:MAG: glycosyltransferase family 4 protein [Thermodesulfobacteriota bacterium]